MFSRSLGYLALAAGLALTGCGKDEPAKPYAVEEVPLSQIADDLAAGRTTSVAVTQGYIERIEMYNGAVNGVIGVAPDALEQAAASDQRRKDGTSLGPMDGIPILIKDNIDYEPTLNWFCKNCSPALRRELGLPSVTNGKHFVRCFEWIRGVMDKKIKKAKGWVRRNEGNVLEGDNEDSEAREEWIW